MNKTSFEKIFSFLKKLRMTDSEKTIIRQNLTQHIHAKKIPSYLFIRKFSILAFSLIFVMSSGGILASASQGSLPGDFLYPIKRGTESVKTLTINNPSTKTNYNLELLEKRFTEANVLITQKKMTKESEQILAQAISQHTNDAENQTNIIAEHDPAKALIYTNKLTNILETGSSILLAIADQQPTQETPTVVHTPTKLVLATQQTANNISIKTKDLENIVLADTDDSTIELSEEKYQEAKKIIDEHTKNQENINIFTSETKPINDISIVNTDVIPTLASETTLISVSASSSTSLVNVPIQNILISETTSTTVNLSKLESDLLKKTTDIETISERTSTTVYNTEMFDIQNLITELETAHQEKLYGKTIVTADKIIQYFSNQEKIKLSEEKYNTNISKKFIPMKNIIPLPPETKEITSSSPITESKTFINKQKNSEKPQTIPE